MAVAGFTAVVLTRVRAACQTKYRPDRSRRVSPSSPCTSGETWGSTSRATASGAWGFACLWLSCRTGGLNWCTGFLLTHRMRGSSQQRAARGEASKTQCRCWLMDAKHADGPETGTIGGSSAPADPGEHVGVDGHARHLLELGDELVPRASEAAPALSPLVGPLEGNRGTGHASDEVAGWRRGGTGGEGPRRQGSE